MNAALDFLLALNRYETLLRAHAEVASHHPLERDPAAEAQAWWAMDSARQALIDTILDYHHGQSSA